MKKTAIALTGLLILVVFVIRQLNQMPTSDQRQPPSQTSKPSRGTVRLVSFNLYNRPWQRAKRLSNALETLRSLQADVITLQEVATGWLLPGDPSKYLARELGMHTYRSWHEENLGVFKTGLAVLSRYPILSSEYHEFSKHDFWDAKGYQLLRIATPRGEIQLVNLHMASTGDQKIRESEWQELADFVQPLSMRGAVLVAGDFNTEPADPALQGFIQKTGFANIYDGRQDLPQLRSWTPYYWNSCSELDAPSAQLLDYVFARGVKLFGGNIVTPSLTPHPSDHCPIAVDVQ